MKLNRRYLTAGATFFLAAATGHVMQSGTFVARNLIGSDTDVVAAAGPQPAMRVTEETEVIPLSADAADASVMLAASASAPDAPVLPMSGDLALRVRDGESGYAGRPTATDAAFSEFGFACAAATFAAEPAPGAMIRATLSAPCAPGALVTLRHEGLTVTVTTDAEGQYEGLIAAFAPMAEVSASLPGGAELSASAVVPDLATVRRVAVQWAGSDGFALVGDAAATVTDHGTGAAPVARRAQVLTMPAGPDAMALDVTAPVTEATCGRPLAGQVIRLEGGQGVVRDLTFAMPGCDALGESVVMRLPAAGVPEAVVAVSAP